MDADFGTQECATGEMLRYIDETKDMTLVYHTSFLYGAYLKENIEMEEYDTAFNHKRLELIHQHKEDPISFVLGQMITERPKDVILFTSGNVEHLIQNVKAL